MSSEVNGKSRAREMATVPSGTWRVAPELSRIEFRVRKTGLYFVKGRFKRLSGAAEIGPDGVPATRFSSTRSVRVSMTDTVLLFALHSLVAAPGTPGDEGEGQTATERVPV